MIEKILLADSGTGHSEEMLQALMAIPGLKRAHVTLLHVVPAQVIAEDTAKKWAEGETLMAKALERLKLDPGHFTTIIREGDPKDVVCHVAEEIDTDLIIMGSRGLSRLVSILENSVSQYVFQLSPRPMLLVKDDIYIRSIQHIMVAANQSAAAQKCLELALLLLRDIPDGRLDLVHVDVNVKEESSGAVAERDPVFTNAIAQAKRFNVKYRCHVSGGNAGKVICRLAEENRSDLLMLGSPDRRPSIAKNLPDLDRLLGSSLSDYVRVHANCPVLLARTGD
jgi:nucleotide-binding universal stress UspA family protein